MEQPTFGRRLQSSLETTSRRSKGKAGCYIFYIILLLQLWCTLLWGGSRTTLGVVKALLQKASWWKGSLVFDCKELYVAADPSYQRDGNSLASSRASFQLICLLCLCYVTMPCFPFRQGEVKKKKKKKKGKSYFLAVETAQLQRVLQILSPNSWPLGPQELEPFARTMSLETWIFMIACLFGAFFLRSESNTLIG